MVTSLLHLASIVGGVVGSVALLGWLARWFAGFTQVPARLRHPLRHRDPVPDSSPHRPLQVVAADLRRLSGQLARVPAGVPMARRRGLQAAYDDILVEAARLLQVPHALGVELEGLPREVERLRLQAALEDAGLAVRG